MRVQFLPFFLGVLLGSPILGWAQLAIYQADFTIQESSVNATFFPRGFLLLDPTTALGSVVYLEEEPDGSVIFHRAPHSIQAFTALKGSQRWTVLRSQSVVGSSYSSLLASGPADWEISFVGGESVPIASTLQGSLLASDEEPGQLPHPEDRSLGFAGVASLTLLLDPDRTAEATGLTLQEAFGGLITELVLAGCIDVTPVSDSAPSDSPPSDSLP